jgi:hypothetical protein
MQGSDKRPVKRAVDREPAPFKPREARVQQPVQAAQPNSSADTLIVAGAAELAKAQDALAGMRAGLDSVEAVLAAQAQALAAARIADRQEVAAAKEAAMAAMREEVAAEKEAAMAAMRAEVEEAAKAEKKKMRAGLAAFFESTQKAFAAMDGE